MHGRLTSGPLEFGYKLLEVNIWQLIQRSQLLYKLKSYTSPLELNIVTFLAEILVNYICNVNFLYYTCQGDIP